MNIQNIPLKGKKNLPVEIHLPWNTETYQRLDEVKGSSPRFEENPRFYIFRLYSKDCVLNGANARSVSFGRERYLSDSKLGL